MEPKHVVINATDFESIKNGLEKKVSQTLFYEIWTTDDYIWWAQFSLQCIILMVFLGFVIYTIYFYYYVLHHPITDFVRKREIVEKSKKQQ